MLGLLGLTLLGSAPALAILPVDWGGLEPLPGSSVEAALVEAAEASGRPARRVDALLMTPGCVEDPTCLETLAAGTTRVLRASVGRVGESLMLSLTELDTVSAEVTGRAASVVASLSAVPDVARALFGELGGGRVLTSTAPALGRSARILVLELETVGVSPGLARSLGPVVTGEAARLRGAVVLSRDDIAALLDVEQLHAVLSGECDQGCLAELAGALGAEHVLTGQVGKLGDCFYAHLTLLDQKHLEQERPRRVTEIFRGDEDELVRAIRQAARRVLGIEQEGTGTLVVTSPEPGARVMLDDAWLGPLPLPPQAVGGGRHALRIERDGFLTWRREVYVAPGETTAVWADLSPRDERWYESAWVWVAVGAAVVGGGLVVGLAARAEPTTGQVRFDFQ